MKYRTLVLLISCIVFSILLIIFFFMLGTIRAERKLARQVGYILEVKENKDFCRGYDSAMSVCLDSQLQERQGQIK